MTAWHRTLREKHPALRSWTYLNSAAAGPVSFEVARAGCGVYESLLSGGDADWEPMLVASEQARTDLAKLAGCTPRELAFTRNTSHSVALVGQMLWETGVRTAVALEDEFPAATVPLLARGFDVKFVKSRDGAYSYEEIADALEGRGLLVSSQVMFRTGEALDAVKLGAIAKERGAHLLLNVTQALGAMQVDFHASGASFLVGTSHKWLCAGYGGGYLAMREELIGELPWPMVGWLSNKEPDLMRNDVFDPVRQARVVEGGCPPFPVLLAVGAAAKLWLETGPERVEARIKSLTAALRERLNAAGFDIEQAPAERLSGITIVPFEDADEVCAKLSEQHIATSARGAGVRIAVHAFNDEADLDRVVEALRALR